jgi:hypothetical protein
LAPAAAAIRAGRRGLHGYGLGVSKGADVARRGGCGDTSALGVCASVSHLPAKKITVAVLSSGDADLGSLTKMLANTALDDG